MDPAHRDAALTGSRAAGRYSTPAQPTLYLSASEKGVATAMIAHRTPGSPERELIAVDVDAAGILDLRDAPACALAGIAREDAMADWQSVLAEGGRPRSWDARDAAQRHGARGLIDPSRRNPEHWHLVLFEWTTRDHRGRAVPLVSPRRVPPRRP